MNSSSQPPHEASDRKPIGPAGTVVSVVERHVAASFCVLLLLIAGIVWVSVRNLAQMRSAISWVDHTHDEIEMLDEIELDVREAEVALRHYLLFREPAALADYRQRGLDQIESHIQALRKLTETHATAGQRRELDEYVLLVRQRVAALERLRLAVEGAPKEMLPQKDIRLIGTQLTEKIAAAFDEFSERERRKLENGIATREADARFAIFAVISSGLVGLAVTGGSLFVILRGLQKRREIQENLRLSLAEKEILLKEVHHRVKNNLQVISGLLGLESEKLKDPLAVSVFNECRDRIHSMARLHQQLYARGQFARVEFGAHLEETAAMLVRSHMPPGCAVELRTEVAPLDVDLDLAVNLGLIANELILNSLKHAFAGRGSGTLTVGLRAGAPGELIVRDDGLGFPPGFDPKAAAGLGLELVFGLTAQIRGEAVLRNEAAGGSSAVIQFPVSPPEKTNPS